MVSTKKRLPRQWGMPLLSIAVVMWLSACAMAPGGKIPYDAEVDPLHDAVSVEPITIDLVKAMRPTARPDVASLTALAEDSPSVPVEYDYRIGRGDVLNVIVYDHPELTIPAGSERSAEESGNVVHSDGTIFYPYVGQIKVAGRTVKEVRSEIQRRLSGYIAEPQVDVKVAAFNAQKVYVTGQVTEPGVFPVTNVPLRVLDVLSEAGGLTSTANWHDVILSRDGGDTHISVFDMLSNGDITQNVQLRDGDVLHVPDIGNQQIYVMGEVNEPAAFPMANGQFSLTNAIARAGGIREESADASGIFVIRGNPESSDTFATVYQLNAKNAAALVLGAQFMLQPADVVYVTAAPVSLWNRVLNQILPSLTTLYQATEIKENLE
ncbi:polysaccharide export protein [Halomonas sp. HP20-15]|uniref:polysaccharide export protein n=1 Tax=Halomonas sp. HP20-15 TaxID=3085901 RepID=UPI002981BC30|nr:polysaccharide export protein [Halomonas sp. HP20-15]MDW5377037.1 polysaccharide export protein [Halomonas sp. HP20-15]